MRTENCMKDEFGVFLCAQRGCSNCMKEMGIVVTKGKSKLALKLIKKEKAK